MAKKSVSDSAAISRRSVLAIPAALGATSLTSRWAWAAGPAIKEGGTLKAVGYANPTSLDPHTGGSGADFLYLAPIYNNLIESTPDTQEPRPGLATSWEWSNPTTLVLKLRQGVTFHDGTPFNAEAVKANFEHMQTSPLSTVKTDIKPVKSVTVTDPYTVTIALSEVDTSFPMVLTDRAGMMSSPKAFTEKGADYNRNPVGTGAFQFVRWDDNDKIILKRNPKYWQQGVTHLDEILFTIIADYNTALRAVTAGQQDWMLRVDPSQVAVAKRSANINVGVTPTLGLQQCYINFSRPPFSDVRVRQAMNYAIDRNAFAKITMASLSEPADTYLPKSHWAYDAQAASRYPYDPEKAKALLAEAGLANSLTVNCSMYSDQTTAQRADILASYFGKVGIKMTRTVGTLAHTLDLWRQGTGDIRMVGWNGRPDPALTYALIFSPESAFNIGAAVPSPDLIKQISESRKFEKLEDRKAAMVKVLRLEREFALGIPLAFEPYITAYSKKVKGEVTNVGGRPHLETVYKDA